MTSEQVRKFRLSLGWDQERFAVVVGSSSRAIQRYEAGNTIPGSARRSIEALMYIDDCKMLDGYLKQYVDIE